MLVSINSAQRSASGREWCNVFDTEKNDAVNASEMGNSSLKERFVLAAKAGFLLMTGVLAVQIFMKAVYFAHL